MNTILKKDLWRYEGPKCHNFWVQLRYILFTPGYTYTYLFRKCQIGGIFKLLWMCLLKLHSWKFSFQIPYQTIIGEGLHIGHFGQIIVNPSSKIGKNCNLNAGALIGSNTGKNSGCPIIGDNVHIGINAIIIGGITIGDDVLVAPGAFINFNVPSNCIVIGNPGQIIKKNYSPTAKHIVYPVQEYK